MIDGNTLILWGFKPGSYFKKAIVYANWLQSTGASEDIIFEELQRFVPVEIVARTNTLPYAVFLEPKNQLERENLAAVNEHMDILMRVPTIKAGAVMPDACPAGQQPGTIPVGGVVACEDAIHPGFHSADICCSMAITVFKRDMDLGKLLDTAQAVTHFGPGGRPRGKQYKPDDALLKRFEDNQFLNKLESTAIEHFATQGDGNHFLFVGRLESTGQPAIVSHHGSRGLGAWVYRRGMQAAQRHTRIHAPRLPMHQAWLKADSEEGRAYWEALQVVRHWTRESHYKIHDLIQQRVGNAVDQRYWNEHNFVFQRSDGLFYHAKGATPSYSGFSADDIGYTLIPMNMAHPVLITKHKDIPSALGFAPHGAGRNLGRKAFLRANSEVALPLNIDLRSYCGKVDMSELPAAYKDPAGVIGSIERFGLAEIVDRVLPYGSIMAGDWEADAPWKKGGK